MILNHKLLYHLIPLLTILLSSNNIPTRGEIHPRSFGQILGFVERLHMRYTNGAIHPGHSGPPTYSFRRNSQAGLRDVLGESETYRRTNCAAASHDIRKRTFPCRYLHYAPGDATVLTREQPRRHWFGQESNIDGTGPNLYVLQSVVLIFSNFLGLIPYTAMSVSTHSPILYFSFKFALLLLFLIFSRSVKPVFVQIACTLAAKAEEIALKFGC